jgi:hypothetical protein
MTGVQATQPGSFSIDAGMKKFLPVLVIAIAAFFAILPLILHGYSCGHDFDFHLRSWMEASAQWHAGILKPVWAFHPAWNAGEPRLLFYPPLSWMTGALLTTVLPWTSVSTAFTWLVLFISGLTMYRLMRRWVSPGMAIFAGCLYLANPYMLFCAYERTAYAELMAAAWMPLLLAALLRQRTSVWRIALAVALLWITNAPAAVIGCYSVLLIGAGRLILTARTDHRQAVAYAGRVTAGTALGLLADGFYLLPLAVERKLVQLNLAIVPNARPDANFLFDHTGDAFHNGVLLHSSTIAVVLVAAAVLCGAVTLVLRRRRVKTFSGMHDLQAHAIHTTTAIAVPVLIAYSIVVILLQLRGSAPIWHVAPQLVFLQFPWRFLAMQGAVSVTLVTLFLGALPTWIAAPRLRTASLAVTGIIFATLAGFFLADRPFRQECEVDEDLPTQRQAFIRGDGFEQTDEYTPARANNDVLLVQLPVAWLTPTLDLNPSPLTGAPLPGANLPTEQRLHLDDRIFTATTKTNDHYMVFRIRAFRGWHVLRDGTELTTLPTRKDGLIAVPLPTSGTHRVEIRYRKTIDQYLGGLLSFLAILCLIGIARFERRIFATTA